MISHRTYTFDRDGTRWEVALFRGLDDWRLGVYWERHPRETQVSFHVPCLSLNVLRCR